MEFSAEMIAGLIGGTVVGDPKTAVNNFARIEEGKPGCISFLANPKYEHYVYTTESSIILVNDTFTRGRSQAHYHIRQHEAQEDRH